MQPVVVASADLAPSAETQAPIASSLEASTSIKAISIGRYVHAYVTFSAPVSPSQNR
jgi:hypothetical protein